MDFLSVLKTIAPTVASALGGPLAGVAVSALGSILGVSDATQDKIKDAIESGNMNGEQIAQLKALELQYQNEEKERGFRYSELEFKDRDSARQREVQTKDATNKILAYTIVGSFVAMVAGALLGWAKVDSALAGTLVGYLSAKCEQVLAYYFGSSKGSEAKTDLLAKAQAIK
jgi:hypothetical protein